MNLKHINRSNLQGGNYSKKEKKLSFKLTDFLRHYDLHKYPYLNGTINIKNILFSVEDLCYKLNIPIELLYQIVIECKKERTAIFEDINGKRWIAATQGHSGDSRIRAAEEFLLIPSNNPPPFLFHGTKKDTVPIILKNGLSRMQRHHIHMIGPIQENPKIPDIQTKSGFRNDSNTVIQINTTNALIQGCKFFQSINGVYLTEGINGIIPNNCLQEL